LITAGKNLFKFEKAEREADILLTNQIKQLELMAEDVIPEDAERLAATQVKLEYFMIKLTKGYRLIKNELFELVANFIKKDELLQQ
jgi:hypothetical protein